MNEFTVSEKDSGQRLDKYIARLIPFAPKSFLYKALRNKDIRLNGKKADGRESIQPGDKVLFRFPDAQFADLGGKIDREGRFLSTENSEGRSQLTENSKARTSLLTENSKEGTSLLTENSEGCFSHRGLLSEADLSAERDCPPWLKQNSKEKAPLPSERTLDPKFGTVLYEDEDILLADKKSGVLSQKAKPEDISINEALLDLCGGKTDTFTPSVCNRLDRNTSGLIIFAKTYRGAREMTEALRKRSASKFYLAAVKGRVTESGHLKARLRKSERENIVEVLLSEQKEGDLIETAYEPVAYSKRAGKDLTLLQIELITGKTHQIRAHLASIGLPVLGDVKYGSREDAGKFHCDRLMLHSYRLELPGRDVFFAPVPKAFQKLFDVSDRI